jgi:hypothetical protein
MQFSTSPKIVLPVGKTRSAEQEIKNSKNAQLDLLARLLTSPLYRGKTKRDVCVAVCSHENKLFIASNQKSPEYAKECLADLQELIKNPSKKIYDKILKKAAEKITYIEVKDISYNNKLKEFKEKARECSENKKPDWGNLQALAKKIFKEIKEPSKNISRINQMWKFLMPWHEVGEVVRLLVEKKFDDFLKGSIEQCENKVVYIICEESSPNNEIPIHAEMKILHKLYTKRRRQKQTQEVRYIGSTKKACMHCQAIIEIFNDNGKYLWVNYGTHGGNRIKCKNPGIVTKYNKEQEVKNRIEKIKTRGLVPGDSTTSEIPRSLTYPVYFLDKLRLEKAE